MIKIVEYSLKGIKEGKVVTLKNNEMIFLNEYSGYVSEELEIENLFDEASLNMINYEKILPDFTNDCYSLSSISNFKITKEKTLEYINEENIDVAKTYNIIISVPFFSVIGTRNLVYKEALNKEFNGFFNEKIINSFFDYDSLNSKQGEKLRELGYKDLGSNLKIVTFDSTFDLTKISKRLTRNIKMTEEIVEVENDKIVEVEENGLVFNKEDNIESLWKINGKSIILEGQSEIPLNLMNLIEHNKNISYVTDLYKKPEKIKNIIGFDNLIIQTTGIHQEGLKTILESFDKLNYLPKRAFFSMDLVIPEKLKPAIKNGIIEIYKFDMDNFEVKRIMEEKDNIEDLKEGQTKKINRIK
jgi:hypothetical protein